MNSRKKLHKLIISIVLLIVIHLLADKFYRPWVIDNSISDFGMANSYTQITAVLGISILMVVFEKDSQWEGFFGKLILITTPVISMIVYEFLQNYLPWGTFDVKDIWFTLIGGLIAILVHNTVLK
jgi:glycopeptide antibiotics resistance protein